MTVKVNLWKLDNPVSKTSDFWKHFGLFVKIISIQVRFSKILEHAGSLMRFLRFFRLYVTQNSEIVVKFQH